MARQCDLCGKKPSTGHNVSHANNKTKRRWLPNLQTIKVLVEGRVTSVRACSRCIRSGHVAKVPHNHSGARTTA